MSELGVTHDGKRWSNADQDRVEDLLAYDPTWPAQYDAEARAIRAALTGDADFELVHFGSTAIPGLAAKPIIDIMLISADQSGWPALIEPIEGLGYVFWAENPRRDRLFFVKGMPPFGTQRTHHVHVRTPEDARVALVFRDYLRHHPEEAARYAELKRELAARYPIDRDAYTEGKARYVDNIARKGGTR
ncbi:MAG: GrpB family protein [Candidatus Rokuibacteriota bacterium]|jgi:GrpB-like predicted nucleotidyltransferase (UPF0157 family)